MATIEILSADQALANLSNHKLGRIVMHSRDGLEIFPINYVTDRINLSFRTAPGTKLSGIMTNSDVVFEVDHVEANEAWSVVVKGDAEQVRDYSEKCYIDTLDLTPWVPTRKQNYIRITPREISGRSFRLSNQIERY